jgi:hypothetical protein
LDVLTLPHLSLSLTLNLFHSHYVSLVAGTAGAFSTTPLIDWLGFVYALSHLPVILIVGSILFWLIKHRLPPRKVIFCGIQRLTTLNILHLK